MLDYWTFAPKGHFALLVNALCTQSYVGIEGDETGENALKN